MKIKRMLARWLFFLSCVLFFMAVPVCVYHFWPVNAGFDDETEDVSEEFPDSALQSDSLPTNSFDSESLYSMQTSDSEQAIIRKRLDSGVKTVVDEERFNNALRAGFYCLIASLLISLIIAGYYFSHHGKKPGGIVAAFLVFNFFYLPLVMGLSSLKPGFFFAYFFYIVPAYIENVPHGIVHVLMLLLIYIVTIILAILAARKSRHFPKS